MYRILCFLLLVVHCNTSISQIPVSSRRTNLVKVYHSQIGIKEATGHNDGPDVEKYLRGVGLEKGYPWCAAFVRWCMLQSNINEALRINGAAASCYRPGYIVYEHGQFYDKPLPGDVFTLFFASLHRIGHTGYFDGWGNKSMGTYYTTEGNTSSGGSRDGDGCYRRIRQLGNNTAISRWVK